VINYLSNSYSRKCKTGGVIHHLEEITRFLIGACCSVYVPICVKCFSPGHSESESFHIDLAELSYRYHDFPRLSSSNLRHLVRW
jgi:hypothetical protein